MTEESYYAEVESHFVERRGSPLFISPGEWQLVYEWEQLGVPIRVVKDAIDRVFERPKTRLKPRKLGYCRQSVLAAFRRFREAGMGARTGGSFESSSRDEDSKSLAAHLEGLAVELLRAADSLPSEADEAADSKGFASALRAAAERVRSLGPVLDEGELAHVESSLSEIDRALVSGCESVAVESRREALAREAAAPLERYRERMPPRVYEAALESAYRRRLRRELGLPLLSLYS